MGRSKRRSKYYSSFSKETNVVVKLKLDEDDYRMLMDDISPGIQLGKDMLFDLPVLPRNDDKRKEEAAEPENYEESGVDPSSPCSIFFQHNEVNDGTGSSFVNVNEELGLASELWFLRRQRQAISRFPVQYVSQKDAAFYRPFAHLFHGIAKNVPSPDQQQPESESEYRRISYRDLERLFSFGLGIVTKAPVPPLYKRPSRIPDTTHFVCYPLNMEEGFEVWIYFVNVLATNPVNENAFRVVVSMFAHMLGPFCFLPNRLIAVTRALNDGQTQPFLVRMAGQSEVVTLQFIPSGKIDASSVDGKCEVFIHYFLMDLLRAANLRSFGNRYFLWQENKVMDHIDRNLNFVSLGEGIRLSVGNQDGRLMLLLEPFVYMRDNRSVLAKLKRARDSNENLNDQIRGILVINRFGVSTHRVNDIADYHCPMFTHVGLDNYYPSFQNYLENHGFQIEYPYQPLLTSNYVEEVAGTRYELLMAPELCDEIKPLLVTRKHLRTLSATRILGSQEELTERMDNFVERIHETLADALRTWKLSIELDRIDRLLTKPGCVADASGWFPGP